MPHKHTRRDKDLSTFDLPPTEVANPLPVAPTSRKSGVQKKPVVPVRSSKRKRKDGSDDTPRAFKRLMAFTDGKRPRLGLDDGNKPGKTKPPAVKRPEQKKESNLDLAIRPGERLSEYSRRVDAALPLSGLVNKIKNGKDPVGLKVWQTAKERRMHNMYSEWREIDKRIREKKEEEQELAEEQEMENGKLDSGWVMDYEEVEGGKKKKKKGKRQRYIGETGAEEDDPWEELKRKRGETNVGLHDVAKAPPDLKMVRTKTFVQGASGAAVVVGDIPKSAGSLRQREHLQAARDEVIASYRKMMAAKRQELT